MRIVWIAGLLLSSCAWADCFELQKKDLVELKTEKESQIYVDKTTKRYILQLTCQRTRYNKAASLSEYKKWGPVIDLNDQVSVVKMQEKGATWLTFYSHGKQQTGTLTVLSGKLSASEVTAELSKLVSPDLRPVIAKATNL